jgi:hypothetical protein
MNLDNLDNLDEPGRGSRAMKHGEKVAQMMLVVLFPDVPAGKFADSIADPSRSWR